MSFAQWVEIKLSPEARAEADALVGTGVPSGVYGEVVSAPAVVTDSDGAPLLVAVRYPYEEMRRFRRAARAYPMNTTPRAVGVRNRSNVFGYGARNVVMKRNCCRACSGAVDAPAAHEGIVSAAPILARLLRDAVPELAERDLRTAREAVLPEWRLKGTQWTSGVLNMTSPLPYHYDRNNLEPVWSAMIVARRQVRGGLLHVPEMGLAVECRDGDVVMFPGWRFVHGVTPLKKTARDGYRYTAVFYAVRGMADCLPPDEEMARARVDRTAREDDLRSNDERLGARRP